MKAFVVFSALGMIAVFQDHTAGALEAIGGFCCDDRPVVVCKVWPFRPVGEVCYCPDQGWKGHVCL